MFFVFSISVTSIFSREFMAILAMRFHKMVMTSPGDLITDILLLSAFDQVARINTSRVVTFVPKHHAWCYPATILKKECNVRGPTVFLVEGRLSVAISRLASEPYPATIRVGRECNARPEPKCRCHAGTHKIERCFGVTMASEPGVMLFTEAKSLRQIRTRFDSADRITCSWSSHLIYAASS